MIMEIHRCKGHLLVLGTSYPPILMAILKYDPCKLSKTYHHHHLQRLPQICINLINQKFLKGFAEKIEEHKMIKSRTIHGNHKMTNGNITHIQGYITNMTL